MVAIVVPQWVLRSFRAVDSRWPPDGALTIAVKSLGVALIIAGAVLVLWCIALFARVGKGTLAPWHPTQRLVAVGPYRYVRNPMITGVATILAGEALLIGSRILAVWMVLFLAINYAYFVLFEEPGLERRFGAPYREYKARVPRGLPRRPAVRDAR